MPMYKKLTFLFVATFIIALAFFSSYFVIQEVRGDVKIGGILDMNGYAIYNLPPPVNNSDLVTKGYLKEVQNLYVGGKYINSWCAVQWFDWCSGGYPPPPPPEECNFNGTCEPGLGENKFNCEDCEIIY